MHRARDSRPLFALGGARGAALSARGGLTPLAPEASHV
jgi:hypothetical protein